MSQALHYLLVLDILCVTYFLTSHLSKLVTMPDPQTSDMRQIRYGKWCHRFLWHQLAL